MTFTIDLHPIVAWTIFVQVLYVLFVFVMDIRRLKKLKMLKPIHWVLSIVPSTVGYLMDLVFSLVVTWFMYLDRIHFKSRTFAGKPWKEKIREALGYIGDLTFTHQSCIHYQPEIADSLTGLPRYRHKVAAFWAEVLNPHDKDHVR